jgi:predicted DNA-binding antitoxin AbrB/MazE fold protein
MIRPEHCGASGMKTIHAIYENGVFRPTTPVDLPEGSEVIIEPQKNAGLGSSPPGEPDEKGLAEIYEILSRSYKTGEPDLAARHDEHQP